jgi:DHA2 family multidrug resistance protein
MSLVAYIGIPAEKTNAVAGMINFMRNMGSSVGTSVMTTVIARRSQFHETMLVGHASAGNQAFRNAVNGLTGRLTSFGISPPDAQRLAYGRIYRSIQAQAATLAYIDVFSILAVSASVMFVISFLLAKNDPRAGGTGAGAG